MLRNRRKTVMPRRPDARPGTIAGMACLGVMLCGCRPWRSESLAQSASPDSAIFASLIASLAKDTSLVARYPLVVEPRPLLRDSTVTSVEPRTLAPVTNAELEKRRATLRALKLTEGDAMFAGCPGTISLPDPSDPAFANCPRTSRLVTAIGLPRPSPFGAAGSEASARYRTVRVIIAGMGPTGISADIRDYVLAPSGDDWKVVKWSRLGFWE